MPSKDQREKGRFLTETQLDYLQGKHDPPNRNAEEQMRSKIRDRTIGAIIDLQYIGRYLSKADREHLFNYKKEKLQLGHRFEEAPHNAWGDIGVPAAFEDITRFFYRMLRENGFSRDIVVGQYLESIAEEGEHDYRNDFEWKEGWTKEGRRKVDVEADFRLKTVDDIDVERARERYENGIELSGLEMKALLEQDQAEFSLKD